MDKYNTIQLRNHHLKQGKKNDRTPIYPITHAECVKGLEERISGSSVFNPIKAAATYYFLELFNDLNIGGSIDLREMTYDDRIFTEQTVNKGESLIYTNSDGEIKSCKLEIDDATATVVDIEDVKDGDTFFIPKYNVWVTYTSVTTCNKMGNLETFYQLVPTIVNYGTVHYNTSTIPSISYVHHLNPSVFVDDERPLSSLSLVFDIDYFDSIFGVFPISGRFIANVDDMPLTIPSTISYATNNPIIEAGHTYEYNIYHGIINLIDVTTGTR